MKFRLFCKGMHRQIIYFQGWMWMLSPIYAWRWRKLLLKLSSHIPTNTYNEGLLTSQLACLKHSKTFLISANAELPWLEPSSGWGSFRLLEDAISLQKQALKNTTPTWSTWIKYEIWKMHLYCHCRPLLLTRNDFWGSNPSELLQDVLDGIITWEGDM